MSVNVINFTSSATSHNDVEHGAEEIANKDRIILPDIKTTYVSVDMHPRLQSTSQRRKRNIDGVLYLQANSKQSQILIFN